jgi:apolipoprotein N-acyltransferase
MAFATSYRRAGVTLLATAVTAALVWFGNGLDPHWPLLWFAPIPVLLFASRTAWPTAAAAAFLAWFVGSFSFWRYFHLLGMPPVVVAFIFAFEAVAFTLAVLLFRALLRRGVPWISLFAFPAAWVTYEWVRNFALPHGTAGSLAYTQLNFLPFLQLASATGPWGMSFLLLLFPAAVAIGLHLCRAAPKQAFRIAGTGLGLVAIVLIFGAVRLTTPLKGGTITVGLIASDEPGNVDVAEEGGKTEELFRAYVSQAKELAARGAQVIVIPEKLGVTANPDTKRVDEIFQELAATTGATIVAGMVLVSPPVKYNQARVYTPEVPVLSYDKHHLLPPFESELKPGTTLTLLQKGSATWGVEICKDMDFTPLSREYGRKGVGLMLVPGWDFNMDRWWHGHIAVMRGVEDGFSVVRAAKDGYLTVSDDRGRIVAETRSDSAAFATLLTAVPVAHDGTVYLFLGDWFAWVSVALLIFATSRLLLAQVIHSGSADQ